MDKPEDEERRAAMHSAIPDPDGLVSETDSDLNTFKDIWFSEFAEISGIWFFELDDQLRFTWISRNFEAYSKYPRDWFYGKTRKELGPPDLPDGVWEMHLETLRQHKPFKEFVFRRPGTNGDRWITNSAAPVFDADGRFRGYRGTGADVTSLMQARQEAERNAELIEQAVDGMDELFILCDPDDRIVMFNQRFREINASVIDRVRPGMRFEEFVRLIIAEGLTPESAGRVEDYFEEHMR